MMKSMSKIIGFVAIWSVVVVALSWTALAAALTGADCNQKYSVGSEKWQNCIHEVATGGLNTPKDIDQPESPSVNFPIDTDKYWLLPIVITGAVILFYVFFYAFVFKRIRQSWQGQTGAGPQTYGKVEPPTRTETVTQSTESQKPYFADVKGSVEIDVDKYGAGDTASGQDRARSFPFFTILGILFSLAPLVVGIALVTDGNSKGYFVLPVSLVTFILVFGIRSVASGKLAKRRGSEEYKYIDQQQSR